MRHTQNAKIVATLGPSSSDAGTVRALFEAGADVFRLNLSHGTHDEHRQRHRIIRDLEVESGRPIGIMLDLQGPKLRVGAFADGPVMLVAGQPYRLDLEDRPGHEKRAHLPHPEIFAALKPGANLLINDGRLCLEVVRCGPDHAETIVRVGGELSERKGVNVPDVLLPLSPLTEKDRADLEFGLQLGVDWVALSFVQRAEDMHELRGLIGDRAAIMVKLEKPAAMDQLDAIIAASDGVMVARGDLGVELPPEQVPTMQRRTVRACRRMGKPVVVATQMLESMVKAPVPTRAEASDVATAVYQGADAVMLSAESASGLYPVEAVRMMNRIIAEVEADPNFRTNLDATHPGTEPKTADAICAAMRNITAVLEIAATVVFTASGYSTLRAARERPDAPILSLTPNPLSGRRLTLVWGVHSAQIEDISRVSEMVDVSLRVAAAEGFANPGEHIVVMAGVPFGTSGTTNLLRIVKMPERD